MAHFAELNENNIVLRVIVVRNEDILNSDGNESEKIGINYCRNLFGGEWLQTSYNGNIRKNYAAAGFKYDSTIDAFIAPKPFESWVLDEDSATWKAPVSIPEDDKRYEWDEPSLSWVEINA
jgi:hypothetical protein